MHLRRRHRFTREPRSIPSWMLAVLAMVAVGCGGGGSGASPGGRFGGSLIAISGMVHGGQNPVVGAQVFAYQAGSSGYGKGGRQIACTLTDAHGRFNFSAASPSCSGTALPASLSCLATGSPQLYFLAQGGNPGSGVANPALLMMAAIGNCNNLSSGSFITINEVTTAASVWALSQFMNCSSGVVDGISTGCTANAREIGATLTNSTGLGNAMALAGNLVSLGTGLAQTPTTGKTPPTSEINTLGDILQDCVNSTGAASTACHNLFTCVVPGAKPGAGNLAPCSVPTGGIVPADTLTAALDIARNPVNNVVTLYNLTSKTPAFTPVLAAAPSDWTLAMNYIRSGLFLVTGLAIDAAGNAWLTVAGASSVAKLSPTGSFLNGTGFTGGGVNEPSALAIDQNGDVWVANSDLSVTELTPTGGFVSPTSGCPGLTNCGYTGGGLGGALLGAAIDGAGNAWFGDTVAATIVEISPKGNFLSGPSGFRGGSITGPGAIAIDASGNVWSPNGGNITELSLSGAFLSGPSGYTPFAGGSGIAIDPAGNAWAPTFNYTAEVAPDGTFISPTSGCPGSTNCGYRGGGLDAPFGIAVDSAGDVWIANCGNFCGGNLNGSVTELSPNGTVLSPNSGCSGASNCAFTGGGIASPKKVAVDAGGNVWVANVSSPLGIDFGSITEMVGAASPVLTPMSACLKLNTGRAVCLP